MWARCESHVSAREVSEDGVEVAGLLDTVPDRGELVRKVSTSSLGGVEVGLCDASEHDVSDTNMKLDGMGLEEAVLRSPMVRPMPRRTTRSLCRRRRLVDMREMPSYGTRWRRRTSKRILCEHNTKL